MENFLLSVIIPAFNEQKTIKPLINELHSKLSKSKYTYEIIFIDDGSKDRTFDEAKSTKLVKIYKNGKNKGKGYCLRLGAKIARGEVIAFIDSDGSHLIDDFIRSLDIFFRLIQKTTSKRIILTGTRFKSNHYGTSKFNKIGNGLYVKIMKIISSARLTDITCGLRIIGKNDFIDLDLTASRYTIEVEMIGNALRKGFAVIEVPIKSKQRVYGKSGIHFAREGIIIPVAMILSYLNCFKYISERIAI